MKSHARSERPALSVRALSLPARLHALGLAALLALTGTGCSSQSKPAPATEAKKEAPAAPQAAAPQATESPLTVQTYTSSEGNASVNSYLLLGKKDALLIDAQLVNSEAVKLAQSIKESRHTLRTIYVTHPHPDHFMGLEVLHREFPDAEILARPQVAERMPELYERYKAPLNRFFPGDVAQAVVTPKSFTGPSLTLEGQELKLLEFQDGESKFATAVYVPALKALFCADLVYNHVHPWLNEMHVDGVLRHVKEVRALPAVETIYPGHGGPLRQEHLGEYEAYVNDFLKMAETAPDAEALIKAVNEKYADFRTQAGLRFSANAHIAARDEAQGKGVKPKAGAKGKKEAAK